MKVTQLAALFGSAALAVQHLAAPRIERALTDTRSIVFMVTSTHLVSEICTDIASCPPFTTTAQTSVIYITATTTLCLLSSTPPGYGPSAITATPSPVASSIYPSEPGISVSLITPTLSASSECSGPPPDTSIATMTPSVTPSVSYIATITSAITSTGPSISIVIPPVSSTDAVGTSYPVSLTESRRAVSSGYASPSASSLIPSYTNPGSAPPTTSVAVSRTSSASIPTNGSATGSTSNYVSSGPATPSSSNTNAISISKSSGAPSTGSASSGYTGPPSGVITPSSTYSVGTPSSTTTASETVSSTYPGMMSETPSYPSPSSPAGFSATVVDSTVSITSYQTQTLSSYISAPPSSSGSRNNTETNIQSVPTKFPSSVSAGLSGSGYSSYLYPPGSGNSSMIAPSPSYIEVPINTGHAIGAGKSSLAAIVVAIAFAHFA